MTDSIRDNVLMPILKLIDLGVANKDIVCEIVKLYPDLNVSWMDDNDKNHEGEKQFATIINVSYSFVKLEMDIVCPYSCDSGFISEIIIPTTNTNPKTPVFDVVVKGDEPILVINPSETLTKCDVALSSISMIRMP